MGAESQTGTQGAALIGVMVTAIVASVVIAALVATTMDDATMAASHVRGHQALAAAEAGAYRALAELRRRVRVDLPQRLRAEDLPVVGALCRATDRTGRSPVELVARFALPADRQATDWTVAGETAYLSVGTADRPIRVLGTAPGPAGAEFHATVAVRWSQRPPVCQAASPEGELERYVFWFDHAVLAVGRAGSARRLVCLRSEGAEACARWFPHPASTWQGSHVRSGGALGGWPIVVAERPVVADALLVLGDGPTWMHTGTRIDGSVHTNGALRVAGTPAFSGPVTQVATAMQFYGCGWPRSLEIPDDAAAEHLTVPGCDAPRFGASVRGGRQGVVPIADPTGGPGAINPARAALGLHPVQGPDPTVEELRAAITDLVDDDAPVPPGVYVVDQCGGRPRCGGLYIAGTVRRMRLAVDGDLQALFIVLDQAGDRPPQARSG